MIHSQEKKEIKRNYPWRSSGIGITKQELKLTVLEMLRGVKEPLTKS